MKLHERASDFEELGARVVAIANDDAAALQQLADKEAPSLEFLVDSDSSVIRAYGVLNEATGNLPHPTVVVVDAEGVVRFFHSDPDYKKRPSPGRVLKALVPEG